STHKQYCDSFCHKSFHAWPPFAVLSVACYTFLLKFSQFAGAASTRRDDGRPEDLGDRKSTRLNSSHVSISYAVFCLKKKKILHAKIVGGYMPNGAIVRRKEIIPHINQIEVIHLPM